MCGPNNLHQPKPRQLSLARRKPAQITQVSKDFRLYPIIAALWVVYGRWDALMLAVDTTSPPALTDLQICVCAAHFLQQRSNAVVRKELAAHLGQQHALLAGYLEFLQRSAPQLLALCLSKPPSEASPEGLLISASEVDRAGLLLAPLPRERGEDGGSPMDATPTPFTGKSTAPGDPSTGRQRDCGCPAEGQWQHTPCAGCASAGCLHPATD